ncbi:MAG: ABC transporter substrate-binding protein [Clostridiales Family XIII bacterium]|nr:ABC transporter substrate-binding protein [Clostridiales Family XIII bacterium]
MKKNSIRAAAVCILLALWLPAFTGCEDSVNAILGVNAPEKKPPTTTASQTAYLPMERVRSLNPLRSKDEDTYFIDKLIYESLFELDESLTAVPRLVETYSYSEDGLSLTLRLKTGILWQDGETFDAEDVQFSIESYIAYSAYHLFAKNVANIKKVSVEKNDPAQIVLTFGSRDDTGVELLTFPVLPRHAYKNAADLWSREEDFRPIGTGPYALAEYDPYFQLVLQGNACYHGAKVPENQLVFQILSSRSDALNMLDVNAVSYAVSREGDRNTIYRNPNVAVKSFISNEAVWLGYNFSKEIFRKKKVRQAIAYAIDNAEILETCFFNSGIVNDSLYFPGFLGVGEAADPYAQDSAAAKTLLAESGFSDFDQDGFFEYYTTGPDDPGTWQKISLHILIPESDPSRVATGQIIQTALNRAGLDCELDVRDTEAYETALAESDFDMYVGGGTMNETYDLRPLLHSAYQNPAGYANRSLDELLDRFRQAHAPEDRQGIFTEIRALLTEELPYYCLLYKTYGAVASPALEGVMSPGFNHIYRSCETWSCVYTQE